eukprot:1194534-Prorocentrum_minimum.AAC.1
MANSAGMPKLIGPPMIAPMSTVSSSKNGTTLATKYAAPMTNVLITSQSSRVGVSLRVGVSTLGRSSCGTASSRI